MIRMEFDKMQNKAIRNTQYPPSAKEIKLNHKMHMICITT